MPLILIMQSVRHVGAFRRYKQNMDIGFTQEYSECACVDPACRVQLNGLIPLLHFVSNLWHKQYLPSSIANSTGSPTNHGCLYHEELRTCWCFEIRRIIMNDSLAGKFSVIIFVPWEVGTPWSEHILLTLFRSVHSCHVEVQVVGHSSKRARGLLMARYVGAPKKQACCTTLGVSTSDV